MQRDLGQFETAEGHLRRALELRPEWPPALVVLADVVAIKGDLPAGEAILRSVLAERPDFGPALQRLQALEARRAREGETKR